MRFGDLIAVPDSPQQATFPQCLINDPTSPPIFAIDYPSIGKDGGKVDIDFGHIDETKSAAGLVTALVDMSNPTWPTWTAKDATFTIGQDNHPVFTDGKTVLTQNMLFGSYLSSHFPNMLTLLHCVCERQS